MKSRNINEDIGWSECENTDSGWPDSKENKMESGNGNRKQVVLPSKEHEYLSVILERIAMERCLDGTSIHVTSTEHFVHCDIL